MNHKQKSPIATNNQALRAKPVLPTLSKANNVFQDVQTKEKLYESYN